MQDYVFTRQEIRIAWSKSRRP
ncbi:hypothetical protein N7506_004250 [Penicillium brevicompactum]|nr:hypothetical protein N7506_004250 [Penicillium brevicompactum]